MKKTLLLLMLGLAVSFMIVAQNDKGDQVWQELTQMPNQFNDLFNPNIDADEITIIYIPGTNNPFEKIYSKSKASSIPGNVLLVGGFGEIMKMMSRESKRSHIQEALGQYYQKGSSVLIDLDSNLGKLLAIKGYSIFKLSITDRKIIEIKDYGFDRVEFFQAVKQLENQGI